MGKTTAERINISAGEVFFHEGEAVNKVYLIIKGQARMENAILHMKLESGQVAGIIDVRNNKYMSDYIAVTDITVMSYSIKNSWSLYDIFENGRNYQELMVKSAFDQVKKIMQVYVDRFTSVVTEYYESNSVDKQAKNAHQLNLENWEYLSAIDSLDLRLKHELFTGIDVVSYKHINLCMELANQVYAVMNKMVDIYGMDTFIETQKEAASSTLSIDNALKKDIETDLAKDNIEVTYKKSEGKIEIIESVKKELTGSLDKILEYSGLDADFAKDFKEKVNKYKQIKNSVTFDKVTYQLRKDISEGFYQVYENVFFRAQSEGNPGRLIELFLNYGFMDERGFSQNQLEQLYSIQGEAEDESCGVYSIYEWLSAILRGEKEPSKNEMDLDYKDNLKELKKSKPFSRQEENAYLSDTKNKVRFEIHNMMRATSKITSGLVSVFCPILDPSNLIENIHKIILTKKQILETINKIKDIDYSLFYREYMYYDEQAKIDRIIVMKEVLPNVILMPVCGMKGIMWQEIEGKKRDTSARFILPAMTTSDLGDMLIEMAAVFRWEMCRTIQGSFWNDIRERSLTSEYCDYIQFFRKNRELTEEMKDKVYSQFKSCKNSYRGMFIRDYENWLKYEAKGSLRVNRVARNILFTYCPFSAKYRDIVSKYPAFEDMCNRFNNRRATKLRELKSFNINLEKRNGVITDILRNNLNYYENM